MGVAEVIGVMSDLGIIGAAGQLAANQALRSDRVRRTLERLNINPDQPVQSFDEAYIRALVEYGYGKPEPAVDVFRDEYVREAFHHYWDNRDTTRLHEEMERLVTQPEIREFDINLHVQILEFAQFFEIAVWAMRTPVEVADRQLMEDTHALLEDVDTRTDTYGEKLDMLLELMRQREGEYQPSLKLLLETTNINDDYAYEPVTVGNVEFVDPREGAFAYTFDQYQLKWKYRPARLDVVSGDFFLPHFEIIGLIGAPDQSSILVPLPYQSNPNEQLVENFEEALKTFAKHTSLLLGILVPSDIGRDIQVPETLLSKRVLAYRYYPYWEIDLFYLTWQRNAKDSWLDWQAYRWEYCERCETLRIDIVARRGKEVFIDEQVCPICYEATGDCWRCGNKLTIEEDEWGEGLCSYCRWVMDKDD